MSPARTAALLLLFAGLCVFDRLAFTRGDILLNDDAKPVERIKRDGDVTVLLLDDTGKKKTSPTVGLLSSMARTFVQDGVTTEYATHVIGTTVGDRYAHIVSTGSRVFYDNIKPTNRHDMPDIDLQTILDNLGSPQTFDKTKEEETNFIKRGNIEISSTPEPTDKSNVSVRQEVSVRKTSNSDSVIKPAKVNAKNGLPTFTVKSNDEDYLPALELTTKRDDSFRNRLRSSKNLFRNGFKPIEIKKYETVTYFGFADFTTTVGNTVIVFMPKTPTVQEATGVTSIKGEATLRPEDIISPTKSMPLTSTKTPGSPTERIEFPSAIEPSVATTEETMAIPTEPLSRRISETTRVFNNEQEALGLLKTIGGVDVIDSKTTRLTTFFYGTYTNGKYTQLEQTVSTLLSKPLQTVRPSKKIEISTTKIPTTTEPQVTTEKNMDETTTETEEETPTTPEEETVSPTSTSIGESLYKTYTYLTTFFIPVDESLTTTSIKSRIVLSSEPIKTSEITMTKTITSTTEIIPTTQEDEELKSATDEMVTTTESVASEDKDMPESTVPMKEEMTTENPKQSKHPNDDETDTETNSTTFKPEDEEEVELLFKTLYTTYTYLTTYFQESTTSVLSRESVVTNIITSTLEKDFLATDPAVAGLFDREEGSLLNTVAHETARSPRVLATRVGFEKTSSAFVNKPGDDLFASTLESVDFRKELATPSLDDSIPKTFSRTYTYFTTLSNDGSTDLKSHTEVYTNIIMPSNSSQSPQRIQPTSVKDLIKPTLLKVPDVTLEPIMDEPDIDDGELNEDIDTDTKQNNATSITPSYKYDMTITRNRTNYNMLEEVKPLNNVIGETMITDTQSTLTNNIKRKVSTDGDEDMEISETVNDNIESSPTHQLETSFTTYTYFTTIYKGSSSSEVVSRFETVTNVVPHTIESTAIDNFNGEETTLPVTFFTTYTYWTTLYKDGNSIVTSREDTLTNVVSPSVSGSTQISVIMPTIKPSQTLPILHTGKPQETEPTTFFTTFTYFTTSYLDNETVVNSRLETVTNVLNKTDSVEDEDNDENNKEDSVIKTAPTNPFDEKTPMPVLKPTGLLSTITAQEINNGETTLLTTDVYGTYIDGLYAQILESKSSIVPNVPSGETQQKSKSTGIVALNEGKVVDADGVSTTFYTTKAIGTYIDQLYAQVIESTSSIKVNDKQKTLDPSTTILGTKTYRTGLLSLIEGTSVKDFSTIYYETKVIGKVIDGKYTQEFESDSSIQIGVRPTAVQEIKASSTQLNEIFQSQSPISPSPAAIESSQGENGLTTEKSEEADEDNSSKRKTFPVIRPFASRPRPTFQPKKKFTDSLATINRSITPTIVATPALKTNEKGSVPASRNRFSGVRKSSVSSVSEIIPTLSNSRKYSRSKTTNTPINSPSINFKSRSSSSALKITPTTSLNSFGGSRRSSLSQKPQSSKLPELTPKSTLPSRFRVRPTVSSNYNRFASTVTTSTEGVTANSDINISAVVTEETLNSESEEEQESVIGLTSTTTESSRRGNNPLLKLRRPPLPKTPVTTSSPRRSTGKTTVKTTTSTTTTTPRPQRPKTPSPLITRNRPKPVNGLFPSRGFGKKEQEVTNEPVLDEEKLQQEVKTDEVVDDDFDSEIAQLEPQSNAVTETERPSRGSRTFNNNQVQIRPFNSRRTRTKRQVDFGYRNDNSRSYRNRQPAKNTNADYVYYDEYVEYDTPAPIKTPPPSRRPSSRSRQQQQQKVTPTTSSSNVARSQFTLREKAPTTSVPVTTPRTSNYRRTRPPVVQEATTSKRLSRLRYPTTTPEPVRNNRRYTPSVRRQSTRTRFREDLNTYSNTQTIFDGSITVTHKIPTELTIPIVIGKNTEYKQVLTAKPSIEILGPHQYSTVAGKNGFPTIQLVREVTETLPGGVTEITKYVLYEQPTSSITFTPTYIRGRKTSYTHVIPSTIYEVKPEVSTIQPQLANAPLANLLLSQLLLGNLGIQQTANPLLALNTAMPTAQLPTTEFKTKSTTYVTTVTHSTSTVLPITFRGKVISTTVIDSSTNVITATEYITETIVTTPTIQQSNNQLNTLLLPALLQAQLLGQGTTANSLLGSIDTTHDELLQELIEPTPKYEGTSKDDSKPSKKNTGSKKPPDPPIQPAEASVVTLYVSGKRPGEFSTVLSTVNYDETATVRKREVEPSSVIDNIASTEFEDILLSSSNDEKIPSYNEEETQSLESMLGDVSKNVKIENRATKVKVVLVEPSSQLTQETAGHFLLKGSADTPVQREVVKSQIWSSRNRTKRDASDSLPSKDVFLFDFPKIPKTYLTQSILYNVGDRENSSFTISQKNLQDYKINAKDEQRGFDERRFNFATKKMSNGVEVIVAGDKSTYPGQASVLRVLPTSQAKPITLAPSTLTDHMLMMLPHPIKQSLNNQFFTKTYLTTYTYLTTFLDGEATVVSSREKVVSNVVTDELNKITPTSTLSQVTLTASPSLETGVYHTTYTYLNTFVDGDIPLVMTSQKTVANTVTAPHEFLTPLQPSEPAYHNTNTYLNTVSFTKTLSDGPDYTVVSTEDVLTQVVITQTDNTPTVDTTKFKEENTITDVIKTYYVTYTYYNTIQDKDSTVVKSDISISSDVVTEKYIPVPTKMDEIQTTSTDGKFPIHLYATKTYLTTFTYFTTLLKDNDGKNPSGTQVKSRSKIVQNVVTESLNASIFNSNYLSSLSSSVQNEKIPITATATLENGQRIEFTAMNDALPIEQNVINLTPSVLAPHETEKPVIQENGNKLIENPKETIKPSSVSKVSQKTEVQKPPKKNPPSKSEQKIPVNSIPSVKPENSNVGGMIDFGKIGSSLTALKPVINAVAGIIQNNLKNEQKTKNAQVSQKSTPKPIKQESTSRAPIYIPVGGLADSVGSETIQYPDTDQRHPHVGIARPPVDASLLSGGIPISPGELITTNSDVIIGKPSVLGPRPPTENLNKEEIPFGMRPPPPPPPQFKDKISAPNNIAREHIKNPLPQTDRKNTQPIRYHENRVQAQYQLTNLPVKSEVNIIPLSKPEPWPTKFVTDVQPLVLTNPDVQPQVSYGNQNLITSNQPSFLEHSAVDPLLVNIQPSQVAQVVIPHGSQTALIYSDQPATGHGPKGEIFNDPQPYPENQVNPGFVGLEVYGTLNPTNNVASKIPANAMRFDIPVSPAGITVGDSESHHVILFDNETGEVKTKPVQVLKPQNSNNQYSNVQNSNNQHLKPHNPNNQYLTPHNPNNQYPTQPNSQDQYSTQQNPNKQYSTPQSYPNQFSTPQNNKHSQQQKPINQYPTSQNSNNQYLTPPSISQVNSFVRRPEASLSVEDDLLQFEDGEVTQESKKTPLRPGELPFGLHNNESDEDRTPIIRGKPLVGNFNGEEQTLSIGTPINNKEPTELKPGNFVVANQNRPDLKYNIQHSNNEQTINNSIKQNKLIINVPPRDDIKQAMNMDEKLPPLPTIKHEINDLDSQGSTPQPSIVKINHDNEVLGLSPPPMITHSIKYDNVTQRPAGTRRPYNPKPKPSSTPPPYQFEKPLNRRPLKPYNNQEEIPLKPSTTTAKIESVQKWEASINSRPEYRPTFKQEKPDIIKAESKVVSQGPKHPEKTKDKIVIFSDPIISVMPTIVTQDTTKWHDYSPISSTESKIETVQSTTETPALISTTQGIIKTYTTLTSKPTSKTTDYHSVISVVVKNEEKSEEKSGENVIENPTTPKQSSQMRPQVTILQLPERPSFLDEFHKQLHQASSLPTRFVTHTQTMSVTITETTVLQSDGFEPSTHTLVLTKTQTSTLVDTVTEFHTLVKPTQVLSTITTTVPVQIHSDPVLIAPVVEGTKTKTVNASPDENDTLLVVMTDKRGGNHGIPPEIQVPDETNEIGPSDVLLSGILTHSSDTECRPECKASKNEICQRVENAMRCVCRPGFARIFMDRPCKPTYTYTMKLVLDKFRKEPIKYSTQLENPSSNQYQQLIDATREGLNRMSMQSDLRDIYHGVIVGGFEPAEQSEKAIVSYIIQLSENAEDTKLWEATKKSLRATNYSLGGTDVFAARDQLQQLSAEDFDECGDSKFHDCSDNARCFNLHGTYTCSCKDGFTDISQNSQFPGRVCSSELIGFDLCNYHGTCYSSDQDQTICECFQWYAGKHCQFNLKVLLLVLIAIGAMLLSLLVACLLMACCKKRSGGSVMGMYQPQRPVMGFRRYRNMMIATTRGDKRAMISVDTGSETSVDRTPPPYVKQVVNVQQRQANAHVHAAQMKTPSPSSHAGGSTVRSGLEQRDRSLTVMIPRAKYRHNPQQAPSVLTMSTFGPEQKAMPCLDSRQTPTKGSRCSSRKPSDSTQMSAEIRAPQRKKHAAPQQRKPSTGALVSAGFEVSATVVKTKELDEAYMRHADDKPDFNAGRTTAARTVSVARSFDETTVQPPTRCYNPESHYESKSQYSHKTNDEGHTMVERDLGSLYLTPQSKLYKPDHRGSDTSNFDSL